MTRPKGSKNKLKQPDIPAHAKAKGNPEFNITNVEPVEWGEDEARTINASIANAKNSRPDPAIAVGAITQEDTDLELMLNKLDREEPIPDIGPDLHKPLTQMKQDQDHLREHVDNYKPASTINELEEQIHIAKSVGCNSIDADKNLIWRFSRGKDNGMFINVKDIRVNYPGKYADSKSSDRLTIEQRVHGNK